MHTTVTAITVARYGEVVGHRCHVHALRRLDGEVSSGVVLESMNLAVLPTTNCERCQRRSQRGLKRLPTSATLAPGDVKTSASLALRRTLVTLQRVGRLGRLRDPLTYGSATYDDVM